MHLDVASHHNNYSMSVGYNNTKHCIMLLAKANLIIIAHNSNTVIPHAQLL